MNLFISFSFAHVNLKIVNTCMATARRPGAKFTPRKDGSVWKLASLSVKILSVLRFVKKAAIDVKPRALKPEECLPLVKLLGLVDLSLQSLHLGLRRRESLISLRLTHRGRGRCRGRSGGRGRRGRGRRRGRRRRRGRCLHLRGRRRGRGRLHLGWRGGGGRCARLGGRRGRRRGRGRLCGSWGGIFRDFVGFLDGREVV